MSINTVRRGRNRLNCRLPNCRAAPEPTGAIGRNAAGKRKVMVNIDFPNAASIPPISIMNPEPNGPAEPRAGANADPHKRAEKPVGREARQPGAAGPEQGNNTDPVWTPAPLQTR